MSIFALIPTCDDLMSQYTLCCFALTGGVILVTTKYLLQRLSCQKKKIQKTDDAIGKMETCVAVMTESIKNIEKDGMQTRTEIAEINRTLIDKLT